MKNVIISLILFCGAACSADMVLAERLNYRILLPDNATPVQKYAAEELKKYLAEIYSRPIILNGAKPEQLDFHIGQTGNGFAVPGGFGISRHENSIRIYGIDDARAEVGDSVRGRAGTLSGVYYFLRKYGKCVFFAPGGHGESLKINQPLEIPSGHDLPEPSFEVRGFSLATKEFSPREMNDFFYKSLGNFPEWTIPQYQYLFLNRWPKRFMENRPELFAVHNGRRFAGNYPYHFPCLSNPEVLQQVVSDLLEVMAQNPAINNIRMFCDAPYRRCQCELCRNSPLAPYLNGGDNSEEIYTFIDQVAAAVHRQYPDVTFMTQTKRESYKSPPQSRRISPAIVVEALTARPQVTDYSPMLEICRQWRNAGIRVLLKSYPRYPNWKNYPIMNPAFTANYFRTFQGEALGAKNSDLRPGVPYSFCALNNYIQAAILFDAGLDTEKIMAEFCAAAYPGAETEMMDFYREMEKMLGDNPIYCDPAEEIYSPEQLIIPAKLLSLALAKGRKSFWLEQLKRDFDIFHEEMKKLSQKSDDEPPMEIPPAPEKYRRVFVPLKEYKDFQATEAVFSGDPENLLIELTAYEKFPGQLLAQNQHNHRGAHWNDDSFEIIIMPEKAHYPYWQIVVNSRGNYRVLYRHQAGKMEESEEFTLPVTAGRHDKYWRLALSIPIEAVCPARRGRIAIYRNRFLNDNRIEKQQSGLKITGPNYHDTASFIKFSLPTMNSTPNMSFN